MSGKEAAVFATVGMTTRQRKEVRHEGSRFFG